MDTFATTPLLTTEQAAQILGIKPRTLVIWRHEGRSELPFIRLGRAVRYRLEDIQSYIERKTHRQAEDPLTRECT